jgi:hypothetical protein
MRPSSRTSWTTSAASSRSLRHGSQPAQRPSNRHADHPV